MKEKKMNCKELKIWIENATEDEIISVEATVNEHINNCAKCKAMYENILNAFSYMNWQKSKSLPEFKSSLIVDELLKASSIKNKPMKTLFFMSRVAAAIVISLGIITGVIAGGVISKQNTDSSDPWSSEFVTLTEDTGYSSYLFD